MSNYTIHTGVWVNFDASPVLGATLTVPIRWGNYIIAALSSLVAWAGSRAWSLAAYSLHQRLAAKQEKDVLHQQLQVHLRGAGSFLDSCMDGLSLQRAWSGRIEHAKRRTMPLILAAIAFCIAFAAAGVFVAEVATKSYQDVLVLAAPNDCGDFVLQDSMEQHNQWLDVITRYQTNLEFWARNYARDTYTGSPSQYSPFSQPALAFTGAAAPCPYSNGTTCLGPNATSGPAWMIDSGLLNSHIHFGINAPFQDRVAYREVATCAVVDATNLTTQPYSRTETYLGREINMTYIGILQQFGPDLGGDSNLGFEIAANMMYERAGFFSQRGIVVAGETDPGKSLTGPPFMNHTADVVMITTTQGRMFYYAPVDDPYFLAHEAATGDEYAHDLNATVYYPTKPFGLMVCTDQMQICNPRNDQCTEPTGSIEFGKAVRNNTIGLNDAQFATALRLAWSLTYVSGLVSNVAHGTANLLIAEQNGVRGGNAVPPTQWIKEMELWFASGLAAMQSSLLEWVAKPWPQGNPAALFPLVNMTALDYQYTERGLLSQKDTLCRNQLIRSTAAVQNFSVLALIIVIVISVAMILAALLVPVCVDHLRRRRRELSPNAEAGRLARVADDKFNLLAMALHSAGVRGWERSHIGVPVTSKRVVVNAPAETGGLVTYQSKSGADCTRTLASEIDMKKFPPLYDDAKQGLRAATQQLGTKDAEDKLHMEQKLVDRASLEQRDCEDKDESLEHVSDKESMDRLQRRATEQTLVGLPEDISLSPQTTRLGVNRRER